MKCNHCGAETADDSVFCEHCGKKIGEANTPKNDSKKKLTLWIGIAAAAVVAIVFAVVLFGGGDNREASNNQFAINRSYSYTQHIVGQEESIDVKTYFVFTSDEDVMWLMGTPSGNMFPVGFGKYNNQTNEMVFSASDKLHKEISLYRGVDGDIRFQLYPEDQCCFLLSNSDEFLRRLYNDRHTFPLTEDKAVFTSESLVGSRWVVPEWNEELYFVSWNEVIISSEYGMESHAYILSDNGMVSIKSGDNLSDENLIGYYSDGDYSMTLCRDGLDVKENEQTRCVTLNKKTN